MYLKLIRILPLLLVFVGALPSFAMEASDGQTLCPRALSQYVLNTAPVAQTELQLGLRHPGFGNQVADLAEAYGWAERQNLPFWSSLSRGLSKGRYNSVSLGGLGREQLLQSSLSLTAPAPDHATTAILLALLEAYPSAPALPLTRGEFLEQVPVHFHQAVERFLSTNYDQYLGVLQRLALKQHIDPSSTLHGTKVGREILLERIEKEYTRETYADMLRGFLESVSRDLLSRFLAALVSETGDPYAVISDYLRDSAPTRLGGPGAGQALVFGILVSALVPESPPTGALLKREVLGRLSRRLKDLIKVVQLENKVAATPLLPPVPNVVNWGAAAKESRTRPVVTRYRKKQLDKGDVPELNEFDLGGVRPSTPPADLSRSQRRVISEFYRRHHASHNIKYVSVLPLLHALFGKPRKTGSHLIFECPFDDRGVLVLAKHGTNLPNADRQMILSLMQKMAMHYGIDLTGRG